MTSERTSVLEENSQGQEPRAGLLLVGHGTRSRRGIDEFHQLADQVARQIAPTAVEPAFLEMCEPTIRSGLGRLIERGATHVVVSPLLLFAAGHAKRDVPRAVSDALAEMHSDGRVTTTLAGHLGCHPAILELSARRFAQSLHGHDEVRASETCLVLVGRGSPDETAIAQMHEFARLRTAMTPLAQTHVAFLAMAQPLVGDILPQLASRGLPRIVVQPHLLFHGELYDALLAKVAECRRLNPATQWIVTSYLACDSACGSPPDELVTRAVIDRARAAGIRVVASLHGG
ncbi:MAG: sirohydrochlorin chelatase [Planctomycetaceae bacterium]|nr:sirohydrochlorin chelatase [Planctomycetaceae bacterium]